VGLVDAIALENILLMLTLSIRGLEWLEFSVAKVLDLVWKSRFIPLIID